MNFKELLGRRQIKKKVDEGMGDTPIQRTPEIQNVYQEIDTPLDTLTQDLLDSAQEVATLAMDTIQELEVQFKDVPVFVALAQELRNRAFDPKQLDVNPTYTPGGLLSTTQLVSLQREVYEQMSDPRAPFLWDLWNIFHELQTMIWTVRKGWRSIEEAFRRLFGSKKLSDASTDSPGQSQVRAKAQPTKNLMRVHYLDMERVRRLKFEVERIKYKAHQVLTPEFIHSLSMALTDYTQHNPTAQDPTADSLINILSLLLKDQLLELSDDHQRFLSAVVGYYGDWRDFASGKLASMMPHTVLSTATDPVLKFTLHLERTADREDVVMQDFRQQLENVLLQHTQKVEDDLLTRESATVDHARDLLHLNVEKAGLLKQYIEGLRASLGLGTDKTLNSAIELISLVERYAQTITSAVNAFHQNKTQDFLTQVSNVQKLLDSLRI